MSLILNFSENFFKSNNLKTCSLSLLNIIFKASANYSCVFMPLNHIVNFNLVFKVVICQNTARSTSMVQGAMTHELIHMFDYCRHKMDLTDIRHLACTEVRAANLVHCSYLSAFIQGTASLFTIKQYHQVIFVDMFKCRGEFLIFI